MFTTLHVMHFSRSVIAQMTGYSAAYVGEVLSSVGLAERWDHVEDCMTAVRKTDPTLSKACAELVAIRRNFSTP